MSIVRGILYAILFLAERLPKLVKNYQAERGKRKRV